MANIFFFIQINSELTQNILIKIKYVQVKCILAQINYIILHGKMFKNVNAEIYKIYFSQLNF